MILNDPNLTAKQNNFCWYYLQSFNATKAYQQAYGVKYSTAARDGHRLLMNNDEISRHLHHIREHQSNDLYCDKLDVLSRLIEMFFANVGDYVHFGNHPAIDKNGHHYHRSYLYFRNDKNVDTSLIQSITKGRNGNRIELPDKIRIAALLLDNLAMPTNHKVEDDTLVQAFKNGLKKFSGHNK